MSFCIVIGCKNHKSQNAKQEQGNTSYSISFHSFPKNDEKRQKWLEALHLNNFNPPKCGGVCSAHFREVDFDAARRTLKPNAVPFLAEEYACKISHTNGKLSEKNDGTESVQVQTEEDSDICNTGSAERILNSLRRKREMYKRQIAALRIKLAIATYMRLTAPRKLAVATYKRTTAPKKLYSLRYMLKVLSTKNLITEEDIDVLQYLDTSDLIKRERRKRKQLPVLKTYKPSIRNFALNLYFYSSRAYNYVRKTFYTCLPHAKTLSKWYRSSNGDPGIDSEALKAIRKFADSVPYRLIGSLMFHTMDLWQHEEYYQGKIVGYPDFGNDIECEQTRPAREALVFCIVCLNASLKLPIAYYIVYNMSYEQQASLVKQCLIAVQEAGLLITSLTCGDDLSPDTRMLRGLGCKFDIQKSTFQFWFKHPANDSNVYIFLNPRDTVKLLQCALCDRKELYDDTDNIIKWKHIVNVHELQETGRLHLANKLTTKHMQHHKNKKVKLGMQLLNCSMTNGMIKCKDKLQLSKLTDSSPTIKFITLFNDLFDIFSSKNLRQHGFKKPMHGNNYVEINRKLQECAGYIRSLIGNSAMKTGFRHFLTNIKNLLHMYKFACIDNDFLEYFPTYKLNQDNLELIFSYLRSHYGYNNPTVLQFKSAYKKLITDVLTELQDKIGGNIPLEDIAILHLSYKYPINIINATTNMASETNWLNSFVVGENSDYSDISWHDHSLQKAYPITEYRMELINFIARHVLKEFLKILHCTVCLDTLICQPTDVHVNLINTQNKGSLIYHPSRDLIDICKITENTMNNFIYADTLKSFNIHSFTCRVMQEFTDNNIFAKLKEHINDQCFFSNHRNNLIRGTIMLYSKMRIALIYSH